MKIYLFNFWDSLVEVIYLLSILDTHSGIPFLNINGGPLVYYWLVKESAESPRIILIKG